MRNHTDYMIIVWHFRDFRLEDNPALNAAAKTGMPIIPLFIYDERDFGSAAKVWLHHSLEQLQTGAKNAGGIASDLTINKSALDNTLPKLAKKI